jgi:hypothetical protein
MDDLETVGQKISIEGMIVLYHVLEVVVAVGRRQTMLIRGMSPKPIIAHSSASCQDVLGTVPAAACISFFV